VEGDLCDAEYVECLLNWMPATHLIHLAAQAGVRYSVTHPHSYVRANVDCFVTLMEAVARREGTKLPVTYASSSSVYGLNKKIPFSEKDPVETQANLYGATKRTNELMAHVYHHQYGIPMTGLRFFTVYGPMGRPDMAYYFFTQMILAGDTLTIFENDDKTELKRDFTYIDDIVQGIIAAMDNEGELEIFNLGNNTPETVMSLVHQLEVNLPGHSAKTKQAPIKEGDVPITYADVSHAADVLGYQPKTPLAEGIRKFMEWYKEYFHVDSARGVRQ
jgi:UDP-glucuronate 4-epimerase